MQYDAHMFDWMRFYQVNRDGSPMLAWDIIRPYSANMNDFEDLSPEQIEDMYEDHYANRNMWRNHD